MIHASFQSNDVQGIGTNDLLSIEWARDSLKKFDLGKTLMALKKEAERDPLEGLHHRQLEKSTLLQHALASISCRSRPP